MHNKNSRLIRKYYPKNYFDTMITDPPYGLKFMGKNWDHGIPGAGYWKEFLRVCKPGAIALVFGGTRTYHRLTCAMEDAGWEIRDCMMWLYGSGFPKSHDISKAIDKRAQGDREKFAKYIKQQREKLSISKSKADSFVCGGSTMYSFFEGRKGYPLYLPNELHYQKMKQLLKLDDSWDSYIKNNEKIISEQEGNFGYQKTGERWNKSQKITTPNSDLAQLWNGYGTALKPAWEPIIVAMKPLDGTFAHNAEKHGVAGLWIDGGRIGTEQITINQHGGYNSFSLVESTKGKWQGKQQQVQGRWPANLILDEEAGKMLDEQSGITFSKGGGGKKSPVWTESTKEKMKKDYGTYTGFLDKGGASRFFYTAKAAKSERNKGCEHLFWLDEKQITEELYNKLKAENEANKDNKNFKRHNIAWGNIHNTVKPLGIMEYLCKLTKTPTGGIVLDPFAGSGTTGLACISTGRDCVMFEKSNQYFKIMKARIKGAKQ